MGIDNEHKVRPPIFCWPKYRVPSYICSGQIPATMQRYTCLMTALLVSALPAFCQLTVSHPQTENLTNPLCIDSKTPRFSWQLQSSDRNEQQTAYEINVSGRPDGKDLVWTSGRTTSAASIQVDYSGPKLQSGKRYFWQVRV